MQYNPTSSLPIFKPIQAFKLITPTALTNRGIVYTGMPGDYLFIYDGGDLAIHPLGVLMANYVPAPPPPRPRTIDVEVAIRGIEQLIAARDTARELKALLAEINR